VNAERARELLAAGRARIERELVELVHADEGEAIEAEEFDAANLAPELFQDELAEGRVEELREQLTAVERAEQRLMDGTYGFSILDGQPIPDERLEAIPTAELTAAEQRARRPAEGW
jgi:DnaK suppressor protein